MFLTPILLFLAFLAVGGRTQYFESNVTDKAYLDSIQQRLTHESNSARTTLVQEAKRIENLAKEFVGAQLNENLFIALRVLAEKELVEVGRNGRPHARQDDGEEEIVPQVSNFIKVFFGAGAEKPIMNKTVLVDKAQGLEDMPVSNQIISLVSAITGKPLKVIASTPKPRLRPRPQVSQDLNGFQATDKILLQQQQEIKRLQQLLQSTDTVPSTSQSSGEPKTPEPHPHPVDSPIAQQFLATKLTDKVPVTGELPRKPSQRPYNYKNPSSSKGVAAEGATLRPQVQHQPSQIHPGLGFNQFPSNGPIPEQGPGPEDQPPSFVQSQTPKDPEEDEDDGDEDSRRKERQFGLQQVGQLLTNVFRTTPKPAPPPPPPSPSPVVTTLMIDGQQVIVQTLPAPAPQPQVQQGPEPFNIQTFAQTVGKNFGDIVRVLPSLFQGARQGVQLIQTISSLFGGLDAIGGIADII